MESFKASKRIAAFLAFDGEADPLRLMNVAFKQGKQVYVPIIVEKSKPLLFAPWTPFAKMESNRFNILEPEFQPADLVSAEQLDFVVAPLVGFDEQCNRIGVGGGFYDRSFEFLNEPNTKRTVFLVGFAFELQKLASIEPQPWDIRLDGVATESNLYGLRNN